VNATHGRSLVEQRQPHQAREVLLFCSLTCGAGCPRVTARAPRYRCARQIMLRVTALRFRNWTVDPRFL
jgi:hypothetical protein